MSDVSTYDLAFETVGNATLIVHDRTPIIATDPWLFGSAYFGSWILSHAIPEEQLASIRACPYLWVSHGHPDHLHMASMETLKDKKILLADHVGGRIRDALVADGYQVTVLADREWVQLSRRVRVMSIADVYQDAVLLVDLDGVLVIDANDCNDRGWGPTVRRASRKSRTPILLALAGYGDADMINYFDEQDQRIPPRGSRKVATGPKIAARMRDLGARYYVPFATMHQYQREDSVWANEFTTPLDAFQVGFPTGDRELLPAFIRYDCVTGEVHRIDPVPNVIEPQSPNLFGDDWSEQLTPTDFATIGAYLQAVPSLLDVVDSVTFRVGGIDNEVSLGSASGRSVRFEGPRKSIVNAAEWEIFDDLLIGNFMKTTLIGDWPTNSLRPDFTARLAKFADNGFARSPKDMKAYFAEYRRRAPRDHFEYELRRRYGRLVRRLARSARSHVSEGSAMQRAGQAAYEKARR